MGTIMDAFDWLAPHVFLWHIIQVALMMSVSPVNAASMQEDFCQQPCVADGNCRPTYSKGSACPYGFYSNISFTESPNELVSTDVVTTNALENKNVNDGKQNDIDPSCQLCSDVIANCCLCVNDNATSPVSCVTCYAGFKLTSTGHTCVEVASSSLASWAVCLLVLCILALLAGGIVGAVFLQRKFKMVGKSEYVPPRLPSISELSPEEEEAKKKLRRKKGNTDDKRYTAEPQLSMTLVADTIVNTDQPDETYEIPEVNVASAALKPKRTSKQPSCHASGHQPSGEEMQEIYEVPEVTYTALLSSEEDVRKPSKSAASMKKDGPKLQKGTKPKISQKPSQPGTTKPSAGQNNRAKIPSESEQEIYANQNVTPVSPQPSAASSQPAVGIYADMQNRSKSQPKQPKVAASRLSKQPCVKQGTSGGAAVEPSVTAVRAAAPAVTDDVVYENTAFGPLRRDGSYTQGQTCHANEPVGDDEIYANSNG